MVAVFNVDYFKFPMESKKCFEKYRRKKQINY